MTYNPESVKVPPHVWVTLLLCAVTFLATYLVLRLAGFLPFEEDGPDQSISWSVTQDEHGNFAGTVSTTPPTTTTDRFSLIGWDADGEVVVVMSCGVGVELPAQVPATVNCWSSTPFVLDVDDWDVVKPESVQ